VSGRTSCGAVLAAATIAVLAGCGGGQMASPPSTSTGPAQVKGAGHAVLPDATATDFALHDQRGLPRTALGERGDRQATALDNCAHGTNIQRIDIHVTHARISPALGSGGRKVRILAVSVDPAGDTPDAVRRFIRVHRLGAGFSYLTGTRAELQPVWQAYNVLAIRRNDEVVDHSAPTLLLDARGRPRVYYDADFTARAVAHDVRRLLAG
jgi:protein SCO1/2